MIQIGDEAPNFDLSSTEDALIMLSDEVPRTPVLLYFFAGAAEGVASDLSSLAVFGKRLATSGVKILGIAPLPLEELKALQQRLALPFPLLRDDRDFARHYAVRAPESGGTAPPALVLVDRRQRVAWMSNPLESLAEVEAEVAERVKQLGRSTSNYPQSVINRLVDSWVH